MRVHGIACFVCVLFDSYVLSNRVVMPGILTQFSHKHPSNLQWYPVIKLFRGKFTQEEVLESYAISEEPKKSVVQEVSGRLPKGTP